MNIGIDNGKLVELLKDLVRIDSVNPSLVPGAAGEAEIAEYLREWMVAHGLKTELVEVEPGRTNIVGVLKGTGGGKSLIKTLQRVGRTLRPYPNFENNIKKEAIIVDFYDHLRYLTGQSRKRMEIYKRESKFKVYKHF